MASVRGFPSGETGSEKWHKPGPSRHNRVTSELGIARKEGGACSGRWQRLKGSVSGETEVPPEQRDLKGSDRVKSNTKVCWTRAGLEATPCLPLEENQAGGASAT